MQVAITNRGRRADSYRQFLSPVLDRPNLTVATRSQVSRVAFETRDGTPTAVGVQIQSIQARAAPLQLPSAPPFIVSARARPECTAPLLSSFAALVCVRYVCLYIARRHLHICGIPTLLSPTARAMITQPLVVPAQH